MQQKHNYLVFGYQFDSRLVRGNIDSKMDNLKMSDLLNLFQGKDFQSFVHEVSNGNNEYLKQQVNHHLLKLVGLYQGSKVTKKRSSEQEIHESQQYRDRRGVL